MSSLPHLFDRLHPDATLIVLYRILWGAHRDQVRRVHRLKHEDPDCDEHDRKAVEVLRKEGIREGLTNARAIANVLSLIRKRDRTGIIGILKQQIAQQQEARQILYGLKIHAGEDIGTPEASE